MTKETHNIREIDKTDIAGIVALVRSSFENDYLIPSIYRANGIEKFIADELENTFSPYRYFVLCSEGDIVGYTEYKVFEGASTAFLNIIAVADNHKNKGIGKKLFEFTRAFFLEKGFKLMALDVYVSNSIALNWYANFGFKSGSLTSLYKIELDVENQKEKAIYIQNYPQYKQAHKAFGFYFLEIAIGKESMRLGVIEKDLIVRGNYTQSLREQLRYFTAGFEFENLYFIGNNCSFEECRLVDKIIRMELNLEL